MQKTINMLSMSIKSSYQGSNVSNNDLFAKSIRANESSDPRTPTQVAKLVPTNKPIVTRPPSVINQEEVNQHKTTNKGKACNSTSTLKTSLT